MENLNKSDEQIVREIEAKYAFILNLIENGVDSNKGIFFEKEEFLRVVKLNDVIIKLWNQVKDHSFISEELHYGLITNVDDVIEFNSIYYGYEQEDEIRNLNVESNELKNIIESESNTEVIKNVYNAVELMALGNIEPKYLMKPIIPQQGTAVLAGKPDTGKSQFARQLCIQIALGEKSFLGFELNPIHNQSIYVATEDNKEATTYLISKQFNGLGKDAIENIRFIFGDTMSQLEIIKDLEKELKINPVDLVVVDSFGDIFIGGDTNNNMAMRNTVKAFDKIAKKYNCLILFVHHINKSAYKQSPGQENIQGGAGLVQKVRLAMQLSEGDGDIKFLTVVKGNYCPKEYKHNSIVLNFSEDTFLFSSTGILKASGEIGSGSGNSTTSRDNELKKLVKMFFSDNVFTHGEFVEQYCDYTGKSEPTAKRGLKRLLEIGHVEKLKSNYRLKNSIPLEDREEDEENNINPS